VLRRIFTSARQRWALRLFACILFTLGVTIALMSVASVEPAEDRSSTKPSFVVADEDWPARDSPGVPRVTGSGPRPIDLGVFKHCRVLRIGKVDEQGVDSLMLVTAAPASVLAKDGEIVLRGGASLGVAPSDFQLTLKGQNLTFAQVMPAEGRAVGTLLYLGSIHSNFAGESELLQRARDSGWNVLACSIGFDSMVPEQIVVGGAGSTRLAQRIDHHLADRAYGMEALIAFVETELPEMLVGPRVLIGMSAGAIALPTVAARIGAVDAAVLIGGGENVAEIIACSPLFRQHIELVDVQCELGQNGDYKINRVPCGDPEKRFEFTKSALRKSKLDPHYTATALRGIPTLMVQAKYDNIVPAAAGESMYESLNRPERWQYRTGHIGLTLLMPWKIDYVLDWMTTHAAG
jgi:hypothetical protein